MPIIIAFSALLALFTFRDSIRSLFFPNSINFNVVNGPVLNFDLIEFTV